MKYTYCARTPQMWKAEITDIGECGKLVWENERVKLRELRNLLSNSII